MNEETDQNKRVVSAARTGFYQQMRVISKSVKMTGRLVCAFLRTEAPS